MRSLTTIILVYLLGNLAAATVKNWTYNNTKQDWPLLPKTSCGGTSQSPIDINPLHTTPPDPSSPLPNQIYLNYTPRPKLKIENNGKTLLVNGDMGSILWGTQTYTAIQFTFHQPAEHTLAGHRPDMEMVITHRNPLTSSLLNLALFFTVQPNTPDHKFLTTIGYDNPALSSLRSFAPIGQLNLLDLFLPQNMSKVKAWEYIGSLTSPPCTEGQRFVVFEEMRVMSRRQWDGFARAVGGVDWEGKTGNFRETEELNGREVWGRWLVLRNEGREREEEWELMGWVAGFVVPVVWIASRMG
jgi:carbonic anhydrase